MDKVTLNNGFTLLEMLIVLVIMSIFLLLTGIYKVDYDEEYYLFPSIYLYNQSEAMLKAEKVYMDDYDISFNSEGHVNRAQTLYFINKKIVVELGGGRLVFES